MIITGNLPSQTDSANFNTKRATDTENLSVLCDMHCLPYATMTWSGFVYVGMKCQTCCAYFLCVILIVICLSARASEVVEELAPKQGDFRFSNCRIVRDQPCPYSDIKFYLYTRRRPEYPQPITIGNTMDDSNITKSDFDYRLPTKIIIHGYNSDMFLGALVEIKQQYLRCSPYNVFAVDWATLAPSPCYISAIYNLPQVGKCTAQLVQRIRDLGAIDIHLVGFSLGAHVPNYVAQELAPYKLPRISGLDPAMPGFTFARKDSKLDASDAELVDVIHTNAFIQGTIEPSGHVDFYMNGGVVQPGCWAENRFFACNHHRAPIYFAESITSAEGFWGWPCRNYFLYLVGQCPPGDPQIVVGEHVNASARGMHLVITNSVSPFAVGKFVKPTIEIIKDNKNKKETAYLKKLQNILKYKKEVLTECEDADDFMNVFTPSNNFDDEVRINDIFT